MPRLRNVLLMLAACLPAMGDDWRHDLLASRGIETTPEAMREYLDSGNEGMPDFREAYLALGSEAYPERVRAHQQLIAGGAAALDWLAKQPESEEPEVRVRVDRILDVLKYPKKEQADRMLRHALNSLLEEGNERSPATGGVFYEWFGNPVAQLPAAYRSFKFVKPRDMEGAVADGHLVLKGRRDGDGDQRLVLRAKEWPMSETFPKAFTVSADLKGTAGGAAGWHIGISIGKVRALFHPGYGGGGFRFEQVGTLDKLTSNMTMGFTPSNDDWQRMRVKVRQLEDGDVELKVTVSQGEERFQATEKIPADFIGKIDQIGFDRSGRTGGDALFDDILIEFDE